MRKKIVLILLIIFQFNSKAQDIRYGIRAGLNLSSLKGDVNQEDFSSLIGIHFGGFAILKINDDFSFQPELYFSTQGAKYEYSLTYGNNNYFENGKLILNYINIPLLAKFHVTEEVSFIGGTQINLLLNAKNSFNVNQNSNGISNTYSESVNVKELYKSSTFNFTIGVCYSITKNILMDARYNIGLTSIEKDYNIKNNIAQLSVGYLF